MAKLYFYYSAMNAGKSTTLLQSAHNYQERGMDTLLYTPIIDDRYKTGVIKSRIGLEKSAIAFAANYNFYTGIETSLQQNNNIKCVLIDEAQFLSKNQVIELGDIVDDFKIPVLTYGIRTDFQTNLFPGSMHLLALADELIEIKTICVCGKKAIANMRITADGKPVSSGAQIEIGGNDKYVAMCRKCFKTTHRNKKNLSPQEVVC
ncbi:MAG: thymidine kinase [Legionellales bacterium]|jgi:thymidine kinase|nr:thymidine kinase [Legionellales bacterium]